MTAHVAKLERVLERAAVALLMLAALVPRVRDLAAPFDREVEGWQGAFFAIAAVNYERLGAGAAGGYPVLNIDLGDRSDPERRVWDHPEHWVVYDNHPPFVAWLAWKSIDALAPREWDDVWREGRSLRGVELPERLPFLVLHMAALLALWWAMRESLGRRAALIGLGLAAATPVLAIYATLVNYENPALLCIAVGIGAYARWMRTRARRDAVLLAAAFACAGCVTWAPVFFVAAIAVHAAVSRQLASACRVLAVAGIACVAPLAIHALWARHAAHALGRTATDPLARARELWAPLFDGTHPIGEWLGIQATHMRSWFTLPLLAVALAGAIVSIRRAKSSTCNVAWPLALGGALYLFAFYRHTLDAQNSFLMLVAPAVIAFAAIALDALAGPLQRLRGGIAPLVVAASCVAVFGVHRINQLRAELRASSASDSSVAARVPELPLADAIGADISALVPPGSFAVHPAALGLNLAASFYAWRSLWPIESSRDASADAVADHVGLGRAEKWLVLPQNPPDSARVACDELRTELAHSRAPDSADERWAAWKLRGAQ